MFAVLNCHRKLIRVVLFLVTSLGLSACQPVPLPGNSGGSLAPGASIPVALLVPHGAASPQEQQLARDLENAARLAVSDLKGVKVDLRVYGTAGQADRAQNAAMNAIADGAKIIIGPLHAEAANAVAVAVAEHDINVLAFSNNASIAGGNLFVLGQTFDNTAKRLIGYGVRHGKRRYLTVYSDNLAGQLGKQAIEQALIANGGQSAGSVGYQFSQEGVVSAVARIQETALESNADAVFLTANAADALPLLTQMLPEVGLGPDVIQFVGLSRWDTPPQTLGLSGVQNGWFALPDPQRSAQYRSRFEAAFGNRPHAISGLAYDGIAAIGALASAGNRQALGRKALTQAAGFQGVNGMFRLRADGTSERGLAVATVRNKQVLVIDPAPQSFGRAGF